MKRLMALLERQKASKGMVVDPVRGYWPVDAKVKIEEWTEINKLMGEFNKWNSEKWKYDTVDDLQQAVQRVADGLENEVR
jgi:hypothetical protein